MKAGYKILVLLVALSTLIGMAGITGAAGVSHVQYQPADTAQDPGDNPNENSEADITVEFSGDCTDFTVESTKELSFVSINFNNSTFTYVKYEDEELEERDEFDDDNKSTFKYTGDTEIKSIVVKSGTTEQTFNCDDGETDAEDPGDETECSDGDDNDGDGLVDHPEDPGCETPDDDDERDGADDGTGDDEPDQDDDGVPDSEDNCPETANPDQTDSDNDGVGDACDDTTVESNDATNVTTTSATLNGNLTSMDNESVTVYFEWRQADQDEWNKTEDQVRTETGEFSATLEDLASNTTYEFRAAGETDEDTTFGDIKTFTTKESQDGGEEPKCSEEGDAIAVAVGGASSGDESAENDDNFVDANVQSESDHESDCDTIDADVGNHDTSAESDDDGIDVDAGTNNDATSDDDGLDGDLGSSNTASNDNDDIDADAFSQSEADEDENQIDIDFPPGGSSAPAVARHGAAMTHMATVL